MPAASLLLFCALPFAANQQAHLHLRHRRNRSESTKPTETKRRNLYLTSVGHEHRRLAEEASRDLRSRLHLFPLLLPSASIPQATNHLQKIRTLHQIRNNRPHNSIKIRTWAKNSSKERGKAPEHKVGWVLGLKRHSVERGERRISDKNQGKLLLSHFQRFSASNKRCLKDRTAFLCSPPSPPASPSRKHFSRAHVYYRQRERRRGGKIIELDVLGFSGTRSC